MTRTRIAWLGAALSLVAGLRSPAAEAAAPPRLSLRITVGAKALANPALPAKVTLSNTGTQPVLLFSPSRYVANAPAGRRTALFLDHLPFRRVDGSRFDVLGHDPSSAGPDAAAAPTSLPAGRSLEFPVELGEIAGRFAVPTSFQAVYVNEDPRGGAFVGAVVSPVARFQQDAKMDALRAEMERQLVVGSTAGPNQLVDLPRLGGAPPGFQVRFVGTGTTHTVDALVNNPTDVPIRLRVPSGVRFVAADAGVQPMLAVGTPDLLCPPHTSGWAPLTAFCTDRDKKPPADGLPMTLATSDGVDNGSDGRVDPRAPSAASPACLATYCALGAWDLMTTRGKLLPAGTTSRSGLEWVFEPLPWVPAAPVSAERGVAWISLGDWTPPAAGPFERSRPGPTPTSDPFRVASLPDVSPPLTLRTGPRTAPPGPSFPQLVTLWTIWTATNDGGTPNPAAISTRMETQAKSQGVSDARAKAVGAQVAKEVVPFVAASLANARQLREAEVDWGALDLSLKGTPPPPPAPAPAKGSAPSAGSATAARLEAIEEQAESNSKRSEALTLTPDPTPTRTTVPSSTGRVAVGPVTVAIEVKDPKLVAPPPPPKPPPPPPPPPAPFEIAVDWRRPQDGGDLVPVQAMFLRITGNEVVVWAQTLPDRYGGTMQSYDFTGLEFEGGGTLADVVAAATAKAPPKPTVAELRKACERGALTTANSKIVTVLEKKDVQSLKGGAVTESSRSAEISFEHAWIYDCESGWLVRRLSIRFTVSKNGEAVSEYVVDNTWEVERVALH